MTTTTATAPIDLVYINNIKSGMQVHRLGCADVTRTVAKREADNPMPFSAATEQEALDWVIDPEMQEMGWTTDDVRVFPCCGFAAAKPARKNLVSTYAQHPAQRARVLLGISWAEFNARFGGSTAKIGREVLAGIENGSIA